MFCNCSLSHIEIFVEFNYFMSLYQLLKMNILQFLLLNF